MKSSKTIFDDMANIATQWVWNIDEYIWIAEEQKEDLMSTARGVNQPKNEQIYFCFMILDCSYPMELFLAMLDNRFHELQIEFIMMSINRKS